MTQTRVIDVSTHAVRRDRMPMVRFRITDQDRRPASVVARPNDGPGDRREQFAALQAEKLKAKVQTISETERSSSGQNGLAAIHAQIEIEALATLRILAGAAQPYSIRGLTAAVGISEHRASSAVKRLVLARHATKAVNLRKVSEISITEEGRAYLSRVDQ